MVHPNRASAPDNSFRISTPRWPSISSRFCESMAVFTLPITFNARMISAEQIVAMLDAGGFGTGIGEWRPEKDGQFGRFHVGGQR